MEILETEELVRILAEKVLKEISLKEKKPSEGLDPAVVTAFIGDDRILKDELEKSMYIEGSIKINSTWKEVAGSYPERTLKRLIISELCIDDLTDTAHGKKNIVTEYLLNGGEVLIVEEGLEYRRYSGPSRLISLYDEYFEKIKEFGVKAVRRDEVCKALAVRKNLYIEGVITVNKLKNMNTGNCKIMVRKGNIITAAARDYIKENDIEIYYERGQ